MQESTDLANHMAVGESTAMESAADEEVTSIDKMIEDIDDVLIPEDMKRFLNEQYQHTVGGVSTGRGKSCLFSHRR